MNTTARCAALALALFSPFSGFAQDGREASPERDPEHYSYNQNLAKNGLALQGYDPVAYFEEGQARRGDPRITAQYASGLYRFASEEHRALFLADPERYRPRFGGWCAYGFGMKPEDHPGQLVGRYPVDPRSFLVLDGGLHLFHRSEGIDGLTLWKAGDEAAQLARAEAAWKRIVSPEEEPETP